MVRFWRKPSHLRESLAALLCALVLLAGVVQARASTEFAAKSGFADTLTLCQPKGFVDGHPGPDAECDHCRMPVPMATVPPVAVFIITRFARSADRRAPVATGLVLRRPHLPEARGPPRQG